MDAPALEDAAAGRSGALLSMATIAELAAWTGATGEQFSREGLIVRVARIEQADGASCVFAVDAGTLVEALASGAGAILARVGLEVEVDAAARDERVLWVRDARYAFAVVSRQLRPARLHGRMARTAEVAEDAAIGERTEVGAGAVIEAGVRIGTDCVIGPRVVILAGTTLGDRVVVQAGSVLGSNGFGYVRDHATGAYLAFPQQGTLVMEDDVEVGANTTIDRGALGETRIGRGTKIDNLVHVGHNCRIGRDVVIAAQTGIAGSSVIEDGAVLGGQVGIADHVTVGEGVILGAQAGVPSSKRLYGAGQVFWGTPARPIAQYLRDLARLRRGR